MPPTPPPPPLCSADFAGLSDEEGSSEVFLTTDSDYDSSRAQSPRELDLLPHSPLSSSAPPEPRGFLCSDGSGAGGRMCLGGGGRRGVGLRDCTPDVLQASELQHGREGEPCGGGGVQCGLERRRGGTEQFDSDFILPSRQIELLHITEKRQAFCVRTSSLEFPSSTPSCNQLYCSYSPSPSTSPQRRWHRPSSVERCCSVERCMAPLPPARTLSQDSGTQRLSSASPAAIRRPCQATLRVYPQYCTGLPKETSVKVRAPETGRTRPHPQRFVLTNGFSAFQLCVTPGTSAREMVQLVVQEMNALSRRLLGGGGGGEQEQRVCYGVEQLKHFGLVLVLDNREKWLQDDFCPLELQNPWLRGKLCVRIKEYSPLALKHSRATTV